MAISDNAENKIIQLLQQLVVGSRAPASQPWTSYGSINNSGPITLIGQAQRQIQNAMGAFGPLGMIAGPYVAQWLTGKDFNRTGTLNNPLSGLLAPSGGTYASAYQRLGNQQLLASLEGSRKAQEEDLRKAFYTNYYKMTMGSGVDVSSQVAAALKNPLSLPSALQFAFDPANNSRIMQGIKNTQAGFLYWQDRLGIDGAANFQARETAATAIGNSIKEMAIQANAIQLGVRKGSWKESYGGFTGAEVSQLTSILANASNIFGQDSSERGISTALQNLKKKVQGLTQALAPLKDIFGTDIKAMVDMIQSTTGQNINQLPASMVSSIARSTVDMARYSGATVTQIAQAGQKIFMQSAQMGGTSFSRIGANLTGGIYAALLARGNTPAGVHAAEYSGFVQRTLASSQASAGVDWTAMAYGLWAQQKGNENKSIDDFMAQVRRNRGGGTLMDAVIRTAGARSQQDLLRGRGTIGYRTSLQSGRLAQLGMQGQYYTQLGDAITAMKQQNPNFGAQWDRLGSFMSNDANAALIKELAANGNDKQVVANFAKRAGVSVAAVNTFLNTANMQSYMSAWGTSMQATAYMNSQQQIRKATQDIDKAGTGGLLTFWRAASTANLNAGITFSNGNSINSTAVLAQGRAILGAEKLSDMQARLERVRGVLGEEQAAQYLALAGGAFAKDEEYLTALKNVAGNTYKGTVAQQEAARQRDIGYLKARKQGYLGANMTLTDAAAIKARQEALTKYADKGDKDALNEGLTKALRLQNLSKMKASQLGLSGKGADKKLADFKKLVASGRDLENLQEEQIKKETGMTKEQFKTVMHATGTNYNNQVDVNRMLMTALSLLIKWLQQHPNKGEQK